MAQASRPTPDNGYAVSTDEFERMGSFMAEDGVYGSPADTPVVYADSTGRQVKIRAGKFALVRGYEWMSDPTTDEIVSGLPANTSGNPRIDRLVLQLDRSTRNVRSLYIQGTPAASPVAPALTQSTSFSSGVWQYPLARWQVASGYTTVAATDIIPEHWYPQPSGAMLCTSTSRPFGANVRNGSRMFEHDTGLNYIYRTGGLNKWMRDSTLLFKTSDQQVNNSTGLTDCTGLVWAAEANSTYIFDYCLHVFGDGGVDMKIGIGAPTGATGRWTDAPSQTAGQAGLDTTTYFGNTTTFTTAVYVIGLISGTDTSFYIRGHVTTGSTPGNVGFQFAQNVINNGLASWVRGGSWVRYQQVG